MKKLVIIAALGLFAFGRPVAAQEEEPEKAWSVDLTADLFSDYMFRGFKLYDGTVFQPSVTGNYDFGDFGVLSASTWVSIAPFRDSDDSDFTEVDYTLSWSKEFGIVSVSAGHLWYTYPNDAVEDQPRTNEFFASISVDTILTPTFTIYEDYDSFDSQFYELGFSHTIEGLFGEEVSMTPYAAFGWGANSEKLYYENGLEVITCGLSFELPVGDFTITPALNYSSKVDDATINRFWSGLSVAYSF